MSTETSYTFKVTKTVKVQELDDMEMVSTLGSWTDKELSKLGKFLRNHRAPKPVSKKAKVPPSPKLLSAWGDEGLRKVQILFPDGTVHKVWYLEKYGWSEA